MIFRELPLKDSFLIIPELRKDERGFFARTFCVNEFKEHGLKHNMVQCSTSHNLRRGILRGMHFQREPHPEVKLVRCTKGSIFDVIVDLRPGSSTFGQWHGTELSEKNLNALYIPAGFAHGFQTLEDHSEVFYQMGEFYHPELADGIRWNDPMVNIKWPIANPELNDRDKNFPDLRK